MVLFGFVAHQLLLFNNAKFIFIHKTVLFQAIQFTISTKFSSIWPIDKTLSGATTPGQSGPGSDAKEGLLRISQSSSITGTSPSDCLMSYHGHSLGESYLSAEKLSVYSTAPADWATRHSLVGVLPSSEITIGIFYLPISQLAKFICVQTMNSIPWIHLTMYNWMHFGLYKK